MIAKLRSPMEFVAMLYVQKKARGTANVFVWSVGAVLADLMWFGVLLSLVDAYG